MAKRFTDTEKWQKPWFRKLSGEMKQVWIYLCDNCDHAGIWEGDWELLAFQSGVKTSPEECLQAFGPKRFAVLESGKVFLPSFVSFQYGDELNPSNNTHRSVLSLLKKEGAAQLLPSPSRGARDKDKDTDKDKDQEGGPGGKSPPRTIFPTDGPDDTLSQHIRDTAQRYGIESEEFAKVRRHHNAARIERALGGRATA